jgi:hypothetical protein
MVQYERLRTVDDIPPGPEHYKRIKVRARALMVARNGRRWTKYAYYGSKSVAVAQAYKLRQRREFAAIGRLETAQRLDGQSRRWVVYARFADLAISPQEMADQVAAVGGDAVLDAAEAAGPMEPHL